MNKIDLIKAVAEQVGLTQKEVTAVFDAAIELVTKTLKKGEEVSVAGLGKFVVKNRAARQSMNPRTKELIKVPASKAPTFRAAKALKDAVNK
jgi:DNA-binding protein HU-beta